MCLVHVYTCTPRGEDTSSPLPHRDNVLSHFHERLKKSQVFKRSHAFACSPLVKTQRELFATSDAHITCSTPHHVCLTRPDVGEAGIDASVCAVVALLLAASGSATQSSGGHREGLNGTKQGAAYMNGDAQATCSSNQPHDINTGHGCYGACDVSEVGGNTGDGQENEGSSILELLRGMDVSKNDVRRKLAYVSSSYPAACPSRGMLKQVFNFFQEAKRF
jgi:Rit1 DUSP-like domain